MNGASPAVELVAAAGSEAEAVAEMAARIWPAAYGAILPPGQIGYMLAWMYDPARLRRELDEGRQLRWILHEGQRVGFVGFGPVSTGAPCALHKFYLLPERQGLGLGSAAMDLLCAGLVDAGAGSVELRVNRHNHRAIAFYRRKGFAVRGEDRLDIGGGFVMDDYLMEAVLPLRREAATPGSPDVG